ncbi:MAG: hypothetical protein Q8N01_05135 [Sulfuricurvum sp.]|nr:hypothetical protein [Sulfuricurvum sp.]
MKPIDPHSHINTIIGKLQQYDGTNEFFDKNTGIYIYIYFPYEDQLYKKIASLLVDEQVEVKNRKLMKRNIYIGHINNLSWNEIQLLDKAGSDKFTGMVNLYNKYAEAFLLKQIKIEDSFYYQPFLKNKGLSYES